MIAPKFANAVPILAVRNLLNREGEQNLPMNLTERNREFLWTNDPALAEISLQAASGIRLSFKWYRDNFGVPNELWETLEAGHAILGSPQQLNQYLHSYGPMIESQWNQICHYIKFTSDAYRLVDYGCGQGLAGLLMFDYYGNELFFRVEQIVLVEPSSIALMRAAEIYRGIAPNAWIQCICKNFEDINSTDLAHDPNLISIHILSNVLDVPSYNHFDLFEKMLDVGRHGVIAVSHHRDFNGGSERFREIKEAIEAYEDRGKVKIEFSKIYNFQCNNKSQSEAIAWLLLLEVIE